MWTKKCWLSLENSITQKMFKEFKCCEIQKWLLNYGAIMKQNFIIVNMSIGGDVNSRNGIQIQMTYTERII